MNTTHVFRSEDFKVDSYSGLECKVIKEFPEDQNDRVYGIEFEDGTKIKAYEYELVPIEQVEVAYTTT